MTYLIDSIRRRLRRDASGTLSDTPRSPPSDEAVAVLDALAKVQIAQDALTQAQSELATIDLSSFLRQWAHRPVQLILSVPGAPKVTSPSPTPVNDVRFELEIHLADAAGEYLPDAGPFTLTATPPEAVASFEDAPDNANLKFVNVAPATGGAQPDFTVNASDPNGYTGDLVCHPTAGGPTRLVLGVVSTA